MADSVGNLLGPRGTFVYESDTGVSFNVRLDRSVAIAAGNDLSTNGQLPVLRATAKFPLEPRYIIVALDSNPQVTKRIIIGDIENGLYQSNAPSPVTINNVNYTVTARVGERRLVLKIDPPAVP